MASASLLARLPTAGPTPMQECRRQGRFGTRNTPKTAGLHNGSGNSCLCCLRYLIPSILTIPARSWLSASIITGRKTISPAASPRQTFWASSANTAFIWQDSGRYYQYILMRKPHSICTEITMGRTPLSAIRAYIQKPRTRSIAPYMHRYSTATIRDCT